MTVENQYDIDGILAAGKAAARTRDAMLDAIEPGMTTAELDQLGAGWLERFGARSAPRLAYGFPGATCVSVNEEAAHGVPGRRVLQRGDVVNVDVSVELDGYFADTGGTSVVPPVSALKERLCRAGTTALAEALTQARAGGHISRVGRTIERVARSFGFRVIRNLAGHGIGRSLHEPPEGIFSFFDPRDHRRFRAGLVVAIEPFVSTISETVSEAEDGWTLIAHRRNLSAQFEHTIIVTRGDPIIATLGT